jgi:hypothetical protein
MESKFYLFLKFMQQEAQIYKFLIWILKNIPTMLGD